MLKRKIWIHKKTKVVYEDKLNGAGTDLAPYFVGFIKKNWPKRKFKSALECFGGPGFIGFSLLDEKICERITIADINAKAIECVRATIKKNRLQDRATAHISDNFDAIPNGEKFDLIVANPPNYYKMNPKHPLSRGLLRDLRPNDRGWKIHKKFFRQVFQRLEPGGVVILYEVSPYHEKVYLNYGELLPFFEMPFDTRPRPPIVDFKKMIKVSGLKYLGAWPCNWTGEGYNAFIVAQRPG